MTPVGFWTEENVERLTQLCTQGLSASLIAEQMGGEVTRNMVIGKIARLGLQLRGNGSGRRLSSRPARRAHVPPTPILDPVGPMNDFPASRNACRYPYGELSEGTFQCCGHETHGGTSWCAAHLLAVSQPAPPKRSRSERLAA